MNQKFLSLCAGFLALLLLSACSTPFITNTGRSAVEQMLLCTVIERGIAKVDFNQYRGKKFFVDYSYLAPQVDKDLVKAYLELHLANNGIILADAKTADYKMQPSCGVLATDIDKFLLGTPALPIPVPQSTISIVIPEIPIFLKLTRSGYGRFHFTILNAKTGVPVETIAGVNAHSKYINWVVMLIPFKTHNIPMKDETRVSNEFLFFYEE